MIIVLEFHFKWQIVFGVLLIVDCVVDLWTLSSLNRNSICRTYWNIVAGGLKRSFKEPVISPKMCDRTVVLLVSGWIVRDPDPFGFIMID
ncbi:hypothetical protein C482_07696 [Natrialba chahannaoensis JCM 10990]|uniref:Uncharacterized protein n=1 Tax=Natrialba chahannaoensis JCM 10990 TaxID=1227492 RepID=M0AQU3_9EURY|nr:hypothetical protein C482_07696 [Natrialba chahannaoensis JCM 10990]